MPSNWLSHRTHRERHSSDRLAEGQRLDSPPVIHLALPRDLSVVVVILDYALLVWVSIGHDRRLAEKSDLGFLAQWLMARWLKEAPPSPVTGLERFRNGWTVLAGTALTVGIIVLIYATNPYAWWHMA
jgi:hypothetical protein